MSDFKNKSISVICDNNSMLKSINEIIKQAGYLEFKNSNGQIEYIIDGRDDNSKISASLMNVINSDKSIFYEKKVKASIDKMLIQFNFDLSLIGTSIFADMIYDTIISDNQSNIMSMNDYYNREADKNMMSPIQVERDVRYSIKKSQIHDNPEFVAFIRKTRDKKVVLTKNRVKNIVLIKTLAQIVFDRVVEPEIRIDKLAT